MRCRSVLMLMWKREGVTRIKSKLVVAWFLSATAGYRLGNDAGSGDDLPCGMFGHKYSITGHIQSRAIPLAYTFGAHYILPLHIAYPMVSLALLRYRYDHYETEGSTMDTLFANSDATLRFYRLG